MKTKKLTTLIAITSISAGIILNPIVTFAYSRNYGGYNYNLPFHHGCLQPIVYLNIPNYELRVQINKNLQHSINSFISQKDADSINKLNIIDYNNKINSLRGISQLRNLTTLIYGQGQENSLGDSVKDLNEIAKLPKLTQLGIYSNTITNIDFIKGAKALKELSLNGDSKLEDISGIKELQKLNNLNISGVPDTKINKEVVKILKERNPNIKIKCSWDENQSINIPDSLLKSEINKVLNHKSDAIITQKDANKVTDLSIIPDVIFGAESFSANTVKSFEGINKFYNLKKLSYKGVSAVGFGLKDNTSEISNLDEISQLNLDELSINSTNLENVNFLKGLKTIKHIDLSFNEKLVDISGIKEVRGLKKLDLENVQDTKINKETVKTIIKNNPKVKILCSWNINDPIRKNLIFFNKN